VEAGTTSHRGLLIVPLRESFSQSLGVDLRETEDHAHKYVGRSSGMRTSNVAAKWSIDHGDGRQQRIGSVLVLQQKDSYVRTFHSSHEVERCCCLSGRSGLWCKCLHRIRLIVSRAHAVSSISMSRPRETPSSCRRMYDFASSSVPRTNR